MVSASAVVSVDVVTPNIASEINAVAQTFTASQDDLTQAVADEMNAVAGDYLTQDNFMS